MSEYLKNARNTMQRGTKFRDDNGGDQVRMHFSVETIAWSLMSIAESLAVIAEAYSSDEEEATDETQSD